MSQLTIKLLGSFEVFLDGQVATGFESDKARALLAYLAVEADQPQRREVLANLLWPDSTDQSARANLRRVLSNVRRVIGDRQADPPFLRVSQQTIQFNLDSQANVDVLDLDGAAIAPGTDAPDLVGLEHAEALYRGRFLEGLTVRDSTVFEEWARVTAEQLERRQLELQYALASTYEERGELQKALHYGQRQLELEPWREQAHRQVMRALALDGRRAEALAQFERCRSMLATELGVSPDRETIALYEWIQEGNFERVNGAEATGHRAAPGHNLPAELGPLVGREQELRELSRLLAEPGLRLLTILGPGGIGKTRLALELARSQLKQFRHGVYLVSLASVDEARAIEPATAAALPFTYHQGESPEQQLRDYLSQKEMLLVLDNYEHLLATNDRSGAKVALDLLRAAPGLKIVATSRRRLDAQGEQLYAIRGMEVPTEDMATAGAVGQTEAGQLFVQAARRVQPEFELSAENAAQVAQICRLLEGLPLAILLSASWVEMLTPAEIVEELTGGDGSAAPLDFLAADWQDLPARQRSLRAVLDHSWQLLSDKEREICQQLTVFRGGFTRQAASSVAGASPRDLLALVGRSMLERDSGGRFDMHELLRQYAADHLARSGKVAATRDQHSATYCALLAEHRDFASSKALAPFLARLEDEAQNVRLAWDWAVERQAAGLLKQALTALGHFYEWRTHYEEGAAAFGKAVEALQAMKTPGSESLHLLARLLTWQGSFLRLLARGSEARDVLEESLALLASADLAALDTRPARAFSHLEMGRLLLAEAEYDDSRHHYGRALALYREVGDRQGQAHALAGLGEVANRTGAYAEASGPYYESLALFRTVGDDRGYAYALERLGYILRDQGQLDAAEPLTREALALYEELGDQAGLANGFLALGWLMIYSGRPDEAYPLVEKSAAIFMELGLPPPISVLGIVNVDLGRYGEANTQLLAHIRTSRESGDNYELAQGLNVLSFVKIIQGNFEQAQELLEESMALLQASGQSERLAHAQTAWGYASRGLGNREEAQAYFSRALRTAVEIQGFAALLFAVPGVALLLADQGKLERAVELYATISMMPTVRNSKLRADLAGRELDDLVNGLAPEAAEAAVASGRQMDPWQAAAALLEELTELGWAPNGPV